jgi:hypothetical protein
LCIDQFVFFQVTKCFIVVPFNKEYGGVSLAEILNSDPYVGNIGLTPLLLRDKPTVYAKFLEAPFPNVNNLVL